LALDGDEWSASRTGCFASGEIAPGTHWIGGWVGPRFGLEAVVKEKNPSVRRESKPDTESYIINNFLIFYSSRSAVRMTEEKMMKFEKHVARMK
jgi:hypothetical protein